jgi:hypothetical protein
VIEPRAVRRERRLNGVKLCVGIGGAPLIWGNTVGISWKLRWKRRDSMMVYKKGKAMEKGEILGIV